MTPEPPASRIHRVGLADVVLVVGAGLALGTLIVLVVGAIVRVLLEPGEEPSYVVAFSATSSLIYASLFFSAQAIVVKRRGVSWRELGLRPPRSAFIGRTLGLLAGVMLANVVVGLLVGELFAEPPDVREQLSLSPTLGFSPVEGAWLTFSLVIAAPVVEEILFRGLLFPVLRERWGFRASAAGSSLVFALAHLSLLLVPTLFVLGLALAWLREHFESLYPSIALHALNNSLAVGVLILSGAG